MSKVVENETISTSRVRTLQIIQFSLIMGVTGFAGYVLFFAPPPQGVNQTEVWLFFGMGVIQIILRLIVPAWIVRFALRRIAAGTWSPVDSGMPVPPTDEGKLMAVYHTKMILGSALLEGGAFASIYACLAHGQLISWIMSAVLWLGLVFDFPTRRSVERWVESKLAWIRDERRMSGPPM